MERTNRGKTIIGGILVAALAVTTVLPGTIRSENTIPTASAASGLFHAGAL